jgi:hypothetical protein
LPAAAGRRHLRHRDQQHVAEKAADAAGGLSKKETSSTCWQQEAASNQSCYE